MMPLQEEELEAADDTFVAVRIGEFYSPRKIAFDLHLKLGAGRYLRIFRAGEDFNEAELKSYEVDRGIRHVYFETAYRPVYTRSSAAILQKIAPLSGVPLKTKFGMARILSELYIQQLFSCDDETRPDLVEQGKEICSVLAGWIETEPALESFLLQLDHTDPSPESLSFLTGMFSSALSRRFPWKSRRTTESLLLACFLSELGTLALPPELAKVKPRRMTTSQRKLYEKHPEMAYVLLQDLGSMHETILLIVRQNREYYDGSGFPNRITGEKTLMLAKLVCLCGDLVRASSDFLLPPSEAAKMMFPVLSKKAFTSHPELVAKYDRDILSEFFGIFEEKAEKDAA